MKKVINIISITITLLLACVLFACIPANPGGNVHGKDCDCEICKPSVAHDVDCECEECKPVDIHDADCDCGECKPDYVPKGTFYSLQEAFDNGWLTQNEVRSIAYYHNNNFYPEGGMEFVYIESTDDPDIYLSCCIADRNPDGTYCGWLECATDYVPIPKTPEVLSEETESAMREDRAHFYRSLTYADGTPRNPEITAEHFAVTRYYGVYNDCYAVALAYVSATDLGATYVIAANAVYLWSNRYGEIIIWKEN